MLERNEKKWRPGDLVLHRSAPKVHSMLMEVLETNGSKVKTQYLDEIAAKGWGIHRVNSAGGWHPCEDLLDPAAFLKTDEFLQTLREQMKKQAQRRSPKNFSRQRE